MKLETAILTVCLLLSLLCDVKCFIAKSDKLLAGDCPDHEDGAPTYLADPNDCSAFYECSNGEKILFHCAAGTLFDDVDFICKFEKQVSCGTRPIPDTTPSE
ncbi:hypothetical protein GWI33_015893 [Rhynchophorus ferrugineus]|uniref:Chitin-binding type-2 domain-containing protein n=1 Tax=Rhynchophorus ferrugineus TaxID=354439 RepID=A0A834M3Z7_RHYFE|nr:hypothetical protein GWI33_015893 [Rhynchophorus ferrugineus]